MLFSVSVFLDFDYLMRRTDLNRWNTNSMSETLKPCSTAYFVASISIYTIFVSLLSGYTITTKFIFLVYFTLIAMFTSVNLSIFFMKISVSMLTRIKYYVWILPRYLYLLELTLFESPICSFFRKPRQEVTMNVEVVFFRLLFKRHTLILILIKLLCLSGINQYTSV